MKKTSFKVGNAGVGSPLSPSILAAVLIARDNQVITLVTQKEVDQVINNVIEVNDHHNGHFTVKLKKGKVKVR